MRLYILLRTVVRISEFPEHRPFHLRMPFWGIIRIGFAHSINWDNQPFGIPSHPIPCHPMPHNYLVVPSGLMASWHLFFLPISSIPIDGRSVGIPLRCSGILRSNLRRPLLLCSALLCSALPLVTDMIAGYLLSLALSSCSPPVDGVAFGKK